MDKILSLPPSLVGQFNEVSGLPREEWFATTDPNGVKVGSGGGTAWAIAEHCKEKGLDIESYLDDNKHIIIHAGGQSRRLPSYAPSGKVLAPVPVFRWSRGQKIDQTLLSLQTPLYEKIMERTSAEQNTLIASGDTFIYAPNLPEENPDADVVCYAIWTEPQLASHHGVFFTKRNRGSELDFMLQKPRHEEIEKLAQTHLFLMDIGVWVLSDRAVEVLMKKCGWDGQSFKGGAPTCYDLYSQFGTALGANPSAKDDEIGKLSVAIVTLEGGEFYHFGTSPELISSTEKIQNRIVDQRNIWHKRVKPHPSIFVQNSDCDYAFDESNRNIWIENSHVSKNWQLATNNIVTGVPRNEWRITLTDGQCLDIVPIGDEEYCVRPYKITDTFKGSEQSEKRYPVVKKEDLDEELINILLYTDGDIKLHCEELLSADDISARANLKRLFAQRKEYLKHDLKALAKNYKKSIFFQTDLKHIAKLRDEEGYEIESAVDEDEPELTRMRAAMFNGNEAEAFGILQKSIMESLDGKAEPRCTVFPDQIVWGRSPACLDIAGGWSDTPPYCIQEGGCVVNLAVELNHQPPIQAFVRMSQEYSITMRSIDNGVAEKVTTYDEIGNYATVGSAFSIPKAALSLAGFHPDFSEKRYATLEEQLKAFGGGMEITLLVAIPKGSGLGTSSILAATLLGALSDFCGLKWSKHQICHRTLILEQMLTTGGGWQDQYGGVFSGIKECESQPGLQNDVKVKWLPDNVFTYGENKKQWLLYYTGITRVAKNILGEIVKGMFLNEQERLETLDAIRRHGHTMSYAIETGNMELVGRLLRRSWNLNCELDPGTTTEDVEKVTSQIDELSLGYKLLGAGGGGYMLICAKDADSAEEIKRRLTQNPPNNKARFVEMSVSNDGLQISRS